MENIFEEALNEMKQQEREKEQQAREILASKTEELKRELEQAKSERVYKVPNTPWKNLPIENLPSRGRFYPDDMQINIRAATVKEIRHYSTIDERDELNIDDKLNFIIENCTRVITRSKSNANFKDILEIDRYYILFAIRELTFLEGNEIKMNVECNNCGNTDNVNITKETFPEVVFDGILEKYYNKDILGFNFKIDGGEEINLYLPTLGSTTFSKNYARFKAYNNQYLDVSLLKLAMYLVKDYRILNDKYIKNLSDEINFQWSIDKLQLVNALIDLIDDAILPKLKHVCSICGAEIETNISFQGGYKKLFLQTKEDILSKLI